ncbi:MAG: hypothetical protein M1838_003868 [Thelocarpon superellum]|nr:MAG: hypothetical protein M1838_003868 [Thelocarpon superellum]
MHPTIVLSTLAGLALVQAQSNTNPVTGLLGDAAVITNNPLGATYTANLPGTSVTGYVSGVATSNGTGVQFTVAFSNFPSSGGPFLYHIHDQPVPADGNCTGTLAHLDPYIRGETPPCDPNNPQRCQVGDLSGKYGKIQTSPFSASFVDLYASTVNGIGAFFGNRSITLHYANTTRLTCASFQMGGPTSTAGTTTSGTTTTEQGASVTNANGTVSYTSSTVVPFLGAASTTKSLSVGSVIAAMAVAAGFAML